MDRKSDALTKDEISESAKLLPGLRYALTLCDMACAGLAVGAHIQQLRGAKLCAEHIALAIKNAESGKYG